MYVGHQRKWRTLWIFTYRYLPCSIHNTRIVFRGDYQGQQHYHDSIAVVDELLKWEKQATFLMYTTLILNIEATETQGNSFKKNAALIYNLNMH